MKDHAALQPLYERGRFQTTYHDLTDTLGARVVGATVFETKAGCTRGPYHFHDGVEEWMHVVSGEPNVYLDADKIGGKPGLAGQRAKSPPSQRRQ